MPPSSCTRSVRAGLPTDGSANGIDAQDRYGLSHTRSEWLEPLFHGRGRECGEAGSCDSVIDPYWCLSRQLPALLAGLSDW